MLTLYHLATNEFGDGIDAALCDGNGKLHSVPFDTPTEIQSDHIAKKIMEHCAYYGIVTVATTKTRTGIVYDMEDAKERALKSLKVSELACINDYVKNQLEDRVRHNFPPLPPSGRQLTCCTKHKYNLLKAGIRIIGWEPPYEMADPGLGNTPASSNVAVLELITTLQTQLAQQQAVIADLMQARYREQAKAGTRAAAKAPEHESPTVTDSVQL